MLKNTVKKKSPTRRKKPIARKGPKVSPNRKPEGQTLEQWQTNLRIQAAEGSYFGITPDTDTNGTFKINSPGSRNEYKVVYRGKESEWNYCSCMDFRTNQLGTCKHLEAVRLWITKGRRRTYITPPPYSSIYL